MDDENIIIGITGTLGAGKGTIVEYLKDKKGFKHYSAREFIVDELKKRGLPVVRDNMVVAANDLRKNFGSSYIAESLYKRAQKDGGSCMLESLRRAGDIEALRAKGKLYMFAVEAEPKLRYERIKIRADEQSDMVSFKKFMEDEQKEMISNNPNEQNLSQCIQLADYKFNNSGTVKDLYKQVDKVLKEIYNN